MVDAIVGDSSIEISIDSGWIPNNVNLWGNKSFSFAASKLGLASS
jgi:hypothetical protein